MIRYILHPIGVSLVGIGAWYIDDTSIGSLVLVLIGSAFSFWGGVFLKESEEQ